MIPSDPRGAFRLFHVILAVSLLAMGLMGLSHALSELDEPGHKHYAFVMSLEALGALLLLVPRAVRWGGVALLLVLIPSFLDHLHQGSWELQPLVYAAGVWLVMVHGVSWGRGGGRTEAAA